MRSLWVKWVRLLAILSTSLALISLIGCGVPEPQNILIGASPASSETASLFYLIFIVAVLIFILVEGLLIYFVIRYHRRSADEHPEQYHGNTRLEVTWTLVPALILVVVFAFTIRTMAQTGPNAAPSQGTPIKVVGHQWWWEIDYNDGKVLTASELHIPSGQVVNVSLSSDNVIHSFWVPALMGKTDVVPNHDNVTWLMSNVTGVFDGQCAEFCGTQHANMLFRVIVQSPQDFQTWLTNQSQPPIEPGASSPEAAGKALLLDPVNRCVGCHTINGTNAAGVTGPNLTHFATRGCFAGCKFQNTPDNVKAWLNDPQALKPGNLMVINKLTPDQINSLTAYLESLK